MYGFKRIFLHNLGHSAKISERTAHAYKLRFRIDVFKPLYAAQLFGKELFYLNRLFFGRKVVLREKLRQRNRAERKRFVIKKVTSVVINDFRAAAAYFENKTFGYIHSVDNAAYQCIVQVAYTLRCISAP